MYDIVAVRIAVGILALLAIVLLPVRKDTGRRYAFLGFLAGLVVLFSMVRLAAQVGDLVVDNSDDQIVKFNIDQVRDSETNGHAPRNMLLVDGSSQTMLGLDPKLVQTQLQTRGYEVLVLEFDAGGANTLERYAMMQRFAQEMRRAGLRYGENTRLMMELHYGYESGPTRFFRHNDSSIRSYYYPSIGNILAAMRVYWELGKPLSLNDISTFTDMYAHSLIWDLKIGFAPFLLPFDRIEAKTPFHPNRKSINPKHFHYYNPKGIAKHSRPADLRIPPQLTFERADRISALFDGVIKGTDYFLMTSLNNSQLKYGHEFCMKLKKAACIDGSSPEVRSPTDDARFYFDRFHLSNEGADIYSRYFAEQLLGQGVVVK